MTRNPNPTAAPKGFGARVGAKAGGAGGPLFPWGPQLPLIHAHPSGGASLPITANLCSPRTGPHIPQAILTMNRAPGQPCPGAQHPVAGVAFIFISELKTFLSGDQSLIAAFPSVCRVQQSLAKEFLCLWHVQGLPLCLCSPRANK